MPQKPRKLIAAYLLADTMDHQSSLSHVVIAFSSYSHRFQFSHIIDYY